MILAPYALLIACTFLSIYAQEAPKPKKVTGVPGNIDCFNLEGDKELHDVMVPCAGNITLIGNGYLILDDAKEHEIHDFFENKSDIQMGIRIWAHPRNPVILDLGQLVTIGQDDPDVLGFWIENSNIERIIASEIRNIYGVRIRGNKFLKEDSLTVFREALDYTYVPDNMPQFLADKLKYKRIQSPGECNFDPYNNNFPNFTDCVTVNNLILKDQEKIPATFKPTFISGCVVVQFSISDHDFLAGVDQRDVHSFECSKYSMDAARLNGITLGINRNKKLCYKEDSPLLKISQVSSLRNGYPGCKFQCSTMDIYQFGQRFCEYLDGDLIIDDNLAQDVNITEVTMSLERIEGSVIISELTYLDLSAGVNHIDLRALVAVTGGENYREAAITIENSTINGILLENLTTLSGYDKAFEVNEFNPNLNISDETLFLIETAANGREVIIQKYKYAEEEGEGDDEEEGTDAGMIAGITVGTIVGVLLVAALVVGVVLFLRKYKQRQLKNGKDKTKDKQKIEENEKLIETHENEKSTASNMPGISMDDAPENNQDEVLSRPIAADANYENMQASTATKPVANDENYENMPVTAPMKTVTKDENYANMPTATAMKTVSKDANYANMPTTAALKTAATDANYENLPTAAPAKPVTKRTTYTKMATAAPEKPIAKADENYENMSTIAGPSKAITKNANYAHMPSKMQTKAAAADENYENLAPAASKMTGKTRMVSQSKGNQ